MNATTVETGCWEGALEYAAATDIGRRRSTNQDAYAIVLQRDARHFERMGHLFVVADGMGAHAAGELASSLAVDSIPHHYLKRDDETPPWDAIVQAFRHANASVHARGEANLEFQNMGTTACALLLLPSGALVAHVGDSRVYRLHDNVLEQLTFDHSLVWELEAAGHTHHIETNRIKHIITRSLGPNPEVEVDLEGPFPVQVGDVFLLCTDGLTGQVADEEIADILAHLPPAEATRLLVNLANERGGPDNITVIVLRVVDALCATTHPGSAPARGRRRPIAPAAWLAAGIAGLLGAILAVTGLLIPGGLLMAGALLIVLVAWWQAHTVSASTGPVAGRFGRGPYRRARAEASAELLIKLETIVHHLIEEAEASSQAAQEMGLAALYDEAHDAALQHDYGHALRAYCDLIDRLEDYLRSPP